MARSRLFEIGVIVLVVGAAASVIAGIAEVGYIQCVAASGTDCTGAIGGTQYITVFLANSDMLSVGISVALIGAVIMIGGSITNHIGRLIDQMKTGMTPSQVCPKCGMQLTSVTKFCPNCGNKIGE